MITDLTITPSGGSAFTLATGSSTTLTGTSFATGAGGVIVGDDGVLTDLAMQVQEKQLSRSAAAFLASRFNQSEQVMWTVKREFDNYNDCVVFVLTHGRMVPLNGALAITISYGSGPTSVTLTTPGAFLSRVKFVRQSGVKCHCQYSFKINQAWTV